MLCAIICGPELASEEDNLGYVHEDEQVSPAAGGGPTLLQAMPVLRSRWQLQARRAGGWQQDGKLADDASEPSFALGICRSLAGEMLGRDGGGEAADETAKEEEREAKEEAPSRHAKEDAATPRATQRQEAEERRLSEQAQTARGEREAREKVRAFLDEHACRHLRARTGRRARLLAQTYPLHRAVALNDADMARLLLRSGADGSQRNAWGQTPLQLAEHRNSKYGGFGAVVKALSAAHGGMSARTSSA